MADDYVQNTLISRLEFLSLGRDDSSFPAEREKEKEEEKEGEEKEKKEKTSSQSPSNNPLSPTATTNHNPTFPFLLLPPELRLQIYRHLLHKPKTTHKSFYTHRPKQTHRPQHLHSQIMRVCQKIHAETISILYTEGLEGRFNLDSRIGKRLDRAFNNFGRFGRNLGFISGLTIHLEYRVDVGRCFLRVFSWMRELGGLLREMERLKRLTVRLDTSYERGSTVEYMEFDRMELDRLLHLSADGDERQDGFKRMDENMRLEMNKIILEPISYVRGIETLRLRGLVPVYQRYLYQMMKGNHGFKHQSFETWLRTFPFLRLPRTIRDQIYRLVLQKPKPGRGNRIMKDPPNWYKEYRSGPTDRLGGRPNWYKEYRSGPTDRLGGAILNRLGPHLLRVNRQIKDEAAPILYQEILFVMTLFVGKRGKVATSGLERFGQFAPLIENIRLDLTVRFEDYPRGDNSVALAFVEDLSYKLNTLKNLRRLEIKPRTTIIVESSGTWWKPRRETRVIPNRPEFYMILKAHMFLFEPLSRVRNIGKVLWSVNKPSVYMEHLSEMMESKMRYPHRAIMQFDAAEYEKREADVVRPTTDQQSIFHFLQLPPELRNRIYQLVLLRSEKPRSYIGIPWKEHLPRKPKYQASNRTGPHLLRVNQQIYREAITILYGESMINAAANSGTLVWKPHFRPPGLWNYGRNLAMIENLCLQFNFSTNCGKGLLQVKAMVRSMRNELEAMVNLRELKLYVRHWGLDEEIQVIRSSNHDRLDDIRAKLVSFMSTESALHRDQEELMNFLRLETEVAILEPLSHVRGIRSVKISGPVTTAYGLYLKQMMEADESVPHRAFRGLTAEGQKE